jgi:hypothetical protein
MDPQIRFFQTPCITDNAIEAILVLTMGPIAEARRQHPSRQSAARHPQDQDEEVP